MMLSSTCIRVSCLLVWIVTIDSVRGSGDMDSLLGSSVNQVGLIVSQVVEENLAGCHLVLATTADDIQVFSLILKRLAPISLATIVVDVRSLFSEEQQTWDHLWHGMWGNTGTSCQALILYIGTSNSSLPFRFLEGSGLWLLPETPAVIIGSPELKQTILYHSSLRNTIHVLYLTLENLTHRRIPPINLWLLRRNFKSGIRSGRVRAFRRCLYCNKGEMGVQLLQRSNLSFPVLLDDILFSDKLQNFMGHTLQVVTYSYFPFIDYKQDVTDPDGPLSPLDSLDTRILSNFAAHLNFTYEIREPWDGTWGVPLAGGNWSGIVGTLQHQKADFSLNLTPSAPRMKAMTHSRIYSYDPLLIISLKPRPLPRHLALMRPFEGEVWITIIICTSVSGVVMWLLQKGWSWVSGQRSVRFVSAFFYNWGLLLEEPATYSPINISGQVFVGSWLLSCVVIDKGYSSSLIAHLSVQSKYKPINTFQDLLQQDGWTWGRTDFGGTTFLYFNQSSDPVLQEILRNMPIYEVEQGVERVLDGDFSYIAYKSETNVKILSLYFDKYGNTPLHLSTTEYPILGGNAWGIRRGAPFLSQFRRMKQRLIETGLIDYWMEDVIKIKVRHIRASRSGEDQRVLSEVDTGQVVLGLDHLQGVFYLLLLGYVAALSTLLEENIVQYCILYH